MSRKYSIGIFDSGFGGLDIMKYIVKKLPHYDYIYLGDTARTPYGTRSQESVYKFTEQAVKFLFERNCKLVILACNTASSEALRKIQQGYLVENCPNRRVLGVIIPAAEAAIEKSRNKRIGVVATEVTVKSRAFERELRKLNPRVKVFQKACPLLVPIVESGEKDKKVIRRVLDNYLNPIKKEKVDTLILGCTHYGILTNHIKRVMGNGINIVNEGAVVAEKLKNYLLRHPEIEQSISKYSKLSFLTTDLTDKFKILGSKFFGRPIKPERVVLD